MADGSGYETTAAPDLFKSLIERSGVAPIWA